MRVVQRSDRGEKDLGGGNGKVASMMLAKADAVHPDLVGEAGLVNDIAEHLRMGQGMPVAAGLDVAEGIEPKLNLLTHRFAYHFQQWPFAF
jgi:hypothetical protein